MPITSKTQLANLALSELGARGLTTFEADQSVEANAVRQQFDRILESLLRRYQWSFATRRATLSQLAGVTSSEWGSAWQLPADCLRLIRVVGASTSNPHRDFAIEGRQLLVNGLTLVEIVYISSAVPIGEWDPLFVNAVVINLAAAIAADITKNPAMIQAATSKLENLAIPVAEITDAREVLSNENFSPLQAAMQSSLVRARFGGGGLFSRGPLPIPPP